MSKSVSESVNLKRSFPYKSLFLLTTVIFQTPVDIQKTEKHFFWNKDNEIIINLNQLHYFQHICCDFLDGKHNREYIIKYFTENDISFVVWHYFTVESLKGNPHRCLKQKKLHWYKDMRNHKII